MSPRKKKTASKNTGPAVTRTSSKGTLSPTKVPVSRIKRALADIGVMASDWPDGSLLTLTDNSITSFFVFAEMLNVSSSGCSTPRAIWKRRCALWPTRGT